MDAALDLSAGKLTATGDFGELSVTAGAGRVDVQGSAHSVKTEMNAGRADLALSDVDTADLRVNAGELNATLTGAQPTHLELSASAGAMDVTVPAGSYQVTADTSAGSFENRVGSAPGASSTVQVNVSAGRILLQSGN
jgi:ferric-dicitrate binding protein FerR (iron transport regulator)